MFQTTNQFRIHHSSKISRRKGTHLWSKSKGRTYLVKAGFMPGFLTKICGIQPLNAPRCWYINHGSQSSQKKAKTARQPVAKEKCINWWVDVSRTESQEESRQQTCSQDACKNQHQLPVNGTHGNQPSKDYLLLFSSQKIKINHVKIVKSSTQWTKLVFLLATFGTIHPILFTKNPSCSPTNPLNM